MAISLDRSVHIKAALLQWWGKGTGGNVCDDSAWAYGWSSNAPEYADQYGVGFDNPQDTYKNCGSGRGDYSTRHGQVVWQFTPSWSSGCKSSQAYAKYGPTWSSTSITGIDIGVDSIGIAWLSTDHHWARAARSGTLDVCA